MQFGAIAMKKGKAVATPFNNAKMTVLYPVATVGRRERRGRYEWREEPEVDHERNLERE